MGIGHRKQRVLYKNSIIKVKRKKKMEKFTSYATLQSTQTLKSVRVHFYRIFQLDVILFCLCCCLFSFPFTFYVFYYFISTHSFSVTLILFSIKSIILTFYILGIIRVHHLPSAHFHVVLFTQNLKGKFSTFVT